MGRRTGGRPGDLLPEAAALRGEGVGSPGSVSASQPDYDDGNPSGGGVVDGSASGGVARGAKEGLPPPRTLFPEDSGIGGGGVGGGVGRSAEFLGGGGGEWRLAERGRNRPRAQTSSQTLSASVPRLRHGDGMWRSSTPQRGGWEEEEAGEGAGERGGDLVAVSAAAMDVLRELERMHVCTDRSFGKNGVFRSETRTKTDPPTNLSILAIGSAVQRWLRCMIRGCLTKALDPLLLEPPLPNRVFNT